MGSNRWQEAFLGVSALLGEPLDQVVRALGDAAAMGASRELLSGLGSPSRTARANAIARACVPVAAALDGLRLE